MNLLHHKSGRAILVFSLYLSEGAPIGFIWWALPTILRNKQVEVEQIASLTAFLVLPWVFKFLWAPLVDTLRTPRFGFKGWITCSQVIMAASLLPILFINPAENIAYWGLFLIIHSFAAATQDVAIDALVINTVVKNERGLLNGYMQAGMLVGRSVFGGGALLMVASFGLPVVLVLLMTSILITLVLLAFVKEPAFVKTNDKKLSNLFSQLKLSFGSKNTWLVILFALTGAAAFESAGALAGPFLTDQKVPEETIGFFFAIPVVAAMLLGALAGGKFSDLFNRVKSVSVFLTGFTVVVIIISILHLSFSAISITTYLIAFGAMYFFVGLFTASSYALFMDNTNPKIGATQFSTYMAATNGCESWSVWAAGKITGLSGYSYAFLAMSLVSLLSLFVMRKINRNS